MWIRKVLGMFREWRELMWLVCSEKRGPEPEQKAGGNPARPGKYLLVGHLS